MELYPEFYNDVFGPIMQPGSSSHTAAPCRLGKLARDLLGEEPARIQVLLDRHGSFAGTFGLMAEDKGMVAGVMGFSPDDARLFKAQALAERAGIRVSFEFTDMTESRHINAMKFVLTGRSGRMVSLVGDSTGGGMIETQVVDGYPLRTKGDAFVLLIFDPQQALSEVPLHQLRAGLPGLLEAGTSHAPDLGCLHWCKLGERPDVAGVRAALPTYRVALLEPVLPVVTRPGRKPQLFDTMVRWREIAAERGLALWEAAVQYEMDASGWSRQEVIDRMRLIERKMYRQTHALYEEPVVVPASPFRVDAAGLWERHRSRRLTDDLTASIIKWAHGAGAGIPGVEVVPGPMGGGGGYIYSALCAVKDARAFSDEDVLRGLFVAAGIGAIAYTRTAPTGECTGCTGECGICGAMAAAAVAEMAGGTPEQVENAASFSLQSAIGIPCDPIPGGMGQPCRSRVLSAACMAPVFADLALAGRDAVLPLHEAIDVADAVGRRLPPELLCTSQGGAAAAPSARKRAAAYRAWFEQTRPEDRPPGNLI